MSACSKLEQGSNRDVLKNAFQSCDTLGETMKISGINELAYPEHIDGYDKPIFQAVKRQMIQIIYSNDAGNDYGHN